MDKIIVERIRKLKTDEEIYNFVKERIQELENLSEEKIVGQGYTDSFKDFISSKMHYKPVTKYNRKDTADLVYDDYTPYIEIIKRIKDIMYNEASIFSDVFHYVYNYLPNSDLLGFNRATLYAFSGRESVSIKEVRDKECGLCSERAGLVQNLFKIIGIDSEWVCGYRDGQPHAFNIIYPNGYDEELAVLFDVSHFVSFINEDKKVSFGYFTVLDADLYKKLFEGTPVKVKINIAENFYRKVYNLDSTFHFEGDEVSYTVGLDKKIKPYNHITSDEWLYRAHMENGLNEKTK